MFSVGKVGNSVPAPLHSCSWHLRCGRHKTAGYIPLQYKYKYNYKYKYRFGQDSTRCNSCTATNRVCKNIYIHKNDLQHTTYTQGGPIITGLYLNSRRFLLFILPKVYIMATVYGSGQEAVMDRGVSPPKKTHSNQLTGVWEHSQLTLAVGSETNPHQTWIEGTILKFNTSKVHTSECIKFSQISQNYEQDNMVKLNMCKNYACPSKASYIINRTLGKCLIRMRQNFYIPKSGN